ncbi:MAG: aminoglycoside phosphotransferase family protein [Actinomycetota bacterium]|nr:aminoglycoside phosphotransferase family protein [Actinomycetota bacterium]
MLWPPPARITTPGHGLRGRRASGGATTPINYAAPIDYVVFPSTAKPKLVVPNRPRRVSAAAVRNFNTGSSGRKRLAVNALAGAVRLGVGQLVAGRLAVAYPAGVPASGIEAHLSEVLGRPVQVSLYIGPARAVRKPVLQVLDDRGTTFAFAKLGVDDFTRELVRSEGEVARFLSALPLQVLRVPAVLHSGTWNGHELVVQSAFPRGAAADPMSPEFSAAVNELARARGTRTLPLALSSYWTRLRGRLEAQPPGPFRAVLDDSVTRIEESVGAVELAFGSWHGDWAPWNMTVSDGHLLVWDWERFQTDVPVGFDAVHFDVQGPVVFDAVPPAQAFRNTLGRASRLLAPYGSDDVTAALLVWLYAIELALGYLEDREAEVGRTRMGRMSTWLTDTLHSASERTLGVHSA